MKNPLYKEKQRIEILKSWQDKQKRKNRIDAMKRIKKTDKIKKKK